MSRTVELTVPMPARPGILRFPTDDMGTAGRGEAQRPGHASDLPSQGIGAKQNFKIQGPTLPDRGPYLEKSKMMKVYGFMAFGIISLMLSSCKSEREDLFSREMLDFLNSRCKSVKVEKKEGVIRYNISGFALLKFSEFSSSDYRLIQEKNNNWSVRNAKGDVFGFFYDMSADGSVVIFTKTKE